MSLELDQIHENSPLFVCVLFVALIAGVSCSGSLKPQETREVSDATDLGIDSSNIPVLPEMRQHADCRTYLREEIHTLLERFPAEQWYKYLTKGCDVSVYDSAEIVVPRKRIRGWLAVVRCADTRRSELIWIAEYDSHPLSQLPVETPGDFIQVDTIGDFDRDGSPEALVVGTGGAGMYLHYPAIMRLTDTGEWEVLYGVFEGEAGIFYGQTEILPNLETGVIRFSISSVDENRPYAFVQSSLGTHPFARSVFTIKHSQVEEVSRESVEDGITALSDFILAARERRFGDVLQIMDSDATVAQKRVKTIKDVQTALDGIRLTKAQPDCYPQNCLQDDTPLKNFPSMTIQGAAIAVLPGVRIEEDRICFECGVNDTILAYVASLHKAGDKYVIRSIDLKKRVE